MRLARERLGRGGDGVDGVAEELVLRGLAHVLDAEETLVGGILEQAADEIGHAGEQLADGAVFADAVAHLEERHLQFVGHAVERLELVGARVDAEALGLGDDVGAGPDVVRREVRRDDVDVLEEEEGELLVVGVGLGFFLPDRDGPVALLRDDGLVIPVGALDEADVERPVVLAGPSDEVAEVGLAVAQVGLDGDADGRLRAELGFLEDGLEELEGEVLQLVALHVEVDQRADLGGAAEDRAETLLERGDGVLRIGRVDVGRERGDFDREIEAGQGALRPEVAEAGRRLLGVELRDRVEDLEVALQEHVGLGVVENGLAEEVDGGGEAELGVLPDLLEQVLAGFAGDELAGHVDDLRLDRRGDEGGGEGGGGKAGLEGGVELDGLVAEVFLQVADNLGGRVERGQDVDEAEELGLEDRVLHGPLHQAGVGALLGKQGRGRLLVHEGEELFALGADGGFDFRVGSQESGHGGVCGGVSPGVINRQGRPGRPKGPKPRLIRHVRPASTRKLRLSAGPGVLMAYRLGTTLFAWQEVSATLRRGAVFLA